MAFTLLDILLLTFALGHTIELLLDLVRHRHRLLLAATGTPLQQGESFHKPYPSGHSNIVRMRFECGTIQIQSLFAIPRLEMVFHQLCPIAIFGGHRGPANDLRPHIEGERRDTDRHGAAVPYVRVVPLQIHTEVREHFRDLRIFDDRSFTVRLIAVPHRVVESDRLEDQLRFDTTDTELLPEEVVDECDGALVTIYPPCDPSSTSATGRIGTDDDELVWTVHTVCAFLVKSVKSPVISSGGFC
ncbi:hypothetical protein LCGC14_1249190 [marine sediment metagenome]|uniref:Uncharacterized protein n=1 Tax=marine sediment metagenome TaxID=412755 RepID=A0A0F9LQI8_9ZZZZ